MTKRGNPIKITYAETWQHNLSTEHNHKHKYTFNSYNQEVIHGIYSFLYLIYNNCESRTQHSHICMLRNK